MASTRWLVALSLAIGTALADEWGDWNDLPDNLLESEQDVRSLDELSGRLDHLLDSEAEEAGNERERLLRHWLDQLERGGTGLSLDALLELDEDWSEDELRAWTEQLESELGNGGETFQDDVENSQQEEDENEEDEDDPDHTDN